MKFNSVEDFMFYLWTLLFNPLVGSNGNTHSVKTLQCKLKL